MNLQLRSTDPEPRSFCGFCASEKEYSIRDGRSWVGRQGLDITMASFSQPAINSTFFLWPCSQATLSPDRPSRVTVRQTGHEIDLAFSAGYSIRKHSLEMGYQKPLHFSLATDSIWLLQLAFQLSHGLNLASSAGIPVSQYSIWLLQLAFQSASTRSRPASATVCGLMIHTPLKLSKKRDAAEMIAQRQCHASHTVCEVLRWGLLRDGRWTT